MIDGMFCQQRETLDMVLDVLNRNRRILNESGAERWSASLYQAVLHITEVRNEMLAEDYDRARPTK